MCREMFKTSVYSVYIVPLVHILYTIAVAKKVTLTSKLHKKHTLNPHNISYRLQAGILHPVKLILITLSTIPTTTIFKIIEDKNLVQLNLPSNIWVNKHLQLDLRLTKERTQIN